MKESKRNLIKTLVASSSLAAWTPPIVSAISLPAHARMSCSAEWGVTGLPNGSCIGGTVFVSDTITFGLTERYFGFEPSNIDILNVTSNNPKVTVTWRWSPPYLELFIEEFNPEECAKLDTDSIRETFSSVTFTIETTCGNTFYGFG
ncbi:MAG: hypothetical protein V3V09_09690 [Arenicellales bacterium]